MSQIAEQKCPACGAPLRFDPASGMLVCDYCGTKTELPKVQKPGKDMKKPAKDKDSAQTGSQAVPAGNAAQGKPAAAPGTVQAHSTAEAQAIQKEKDKKRKKPVEDDEIDGFDFNSLNDMVTDPNAMALPIYNCVSCGAEVIAPAEQVALTCPYCGNNIVLTEKVTGKLRPDGVIPFKIQAKDLPAAVNHFYKDKKLLPRHFFSESTMGKVTGVYVPFWVFSGDVKGTLGYNAQTSSSSRSGDYIITQTNYYKLVRDAALAFDNLPVDASGRIEDRLMDSLEPFNAAETQPFDMRYLAGFTADRFDQKKSAISERASSRMKNSAYSIVNSQATAGYGSCSLTKGRLNADINAKYILFPVYMFDISYRGTDYHFAVNGQTGKVVGDVPTDSNVSFLYFLKRFAIVGGGLFAMSVAKYMLGF